MEYKIRHIVQLASAFFLATLFSTPARAADTCEWVEPKPWFVYTVIFFVLIGSLLTLLVIRTALGSSKWSLADALSEEAEVTATDADGQPILDEAKKPVMITEMRASSSRVIALMGMIVILLTFLGFGAFALFSFATTGEMPTSIDKVVNFLVAGLTLFAPYVVNKFSNMFESLAPKKS